MAVRAQAKGSPWLLPSATWLCCSLLDAPPAVLTVFGRDCVEELDTELDRRVSVSHTPVASSMESGSRRFDTQTAVAIHNDAAVPDYHMPSWQLLVRDLPLI